MYQPKRGPLHHAVLERGTGRCIATGVTEQQAYDAARRKKPDLRDDAIRFAKFNPTETRRMFSVEARGDWAGARSSAWRPAVAGTANQTGLVDEDASLFPDETEARAAIDVLRVEAGDVEFRIVEVDVAATRAMMLGRR